MSILSYNQSLSGTARAPYLLLGQGSDASPTMNSDPFYNY